MALTIAGMAVTAGSVPARAIDSNPPTGPGNVEIFTKRDMVAIEGYSEYAGKTAEFTVTRGGTVIGSARGVVDATGFFEVNHPGGACWGDGTNVKVTPDIRGGDVVRVDFLDTGGRWDGAIAQDVEISGVERDEGTLQLAISGTFGPDVDMPGGDLVADPGKFGIEIVNPDMRNATSRIGERAIGWPVEAGEATTGYTVTGGITSGAEGTGGTFEVVYTFQTASDLDLAYAGEHVAQAWQADHPDPNQEAQLGLTMYENGEAPGPGMGGCPAGPQEMRPNSPTTYTAKTDGQAGTSVTVTWNTATTAPEAPAITGYTVRAVSGENEIGKRLPADATSTTITGLTAGEVYDVEVAARSDAGESWRPSTMRVLAAPHIAPAAVATTARQPEADGSYLPLITTANGVDYGVHLDPVPGVMDAEIHYTVDGSTPTVTSPTFVSGESESLQIRQDTTVKWIVVDSGNIVGAGGSQFFDIVDAPEAAPVITALTARDSAVDVTFGRLAGADAYRVQAYDETGSIRVGRAVGVAQPADSTVTEVTRRVPGLTNGTLYTFTVAARFGTAWTAESALSEPIAPVAAPRAYGGEPQTSLRGRTVTLNGSANFEGTYEWVQVLRNTDGSIDPRVTLTNATTATPTFRFPTLSSATSDDGELRFRLSVTAADGTIRRAIATVTAQADAVVAEEADYDKAPELDLNGTGTQENAVLTFHDGSATGAVIGTAVVINGEWVGPTTATLTGGTIFVWSDYGYTGTITVEQ